MCASTSSASSSLSSPNRILPSKDAEGILVKGVKRHLVRQISAPELGKGKDLPSLAEKSCAIWECVGLRPNKIGGFGTIELFKLKYRSDDHETQKQKGHIEQFPAIEMTSITIRNSIYSNKEMEQISSGKLQEDQTLKYVLGRLGVIYREDETGFYVEKPDCPAFHANWERLREEHPQFPPLDVVSDPRIASDLDYFHSLLARDGLMSDGKESFHDLYHLIQWIDLVINTGISSSSSSEAIESYKSKKFQMAKVLLRAYRRIMIAERVISEGRLPMTKKESLKFKKELKKLEANLGAFADGFFDAMNNRRWEGMDLLDSFTYYHSSPSWKNYWKTKRQELGDFDFDSLIEAWNKTREIEREFDKTNHKKIYF